MQSPRHPQELILPQKPRREQKKRAINRSPRTELAPPPEQPRGQTKGESPKYSLADQFVRINPPQPEVLKESNQDHSAQSRATTHLNGHRRRKSEGVAPTHGVKSSRSAADPVVLSPPGTFRKLEAGSPTRPNLNLQVSRKL